MILMPLVLIKLSEFFMIVIIEYRWQNLSMVFLIILV